MEIEVELYARGGGAVSYYWLVVSYGAAAARRGAFSKGQEWRTQVTGVASRHGVVVLDGVDTRYDSGGV